MTVRTLMSGIARKTGHRICCVNARHLMVCSKWEPELTGETLKGVEDHWLGQLKHRNEQLQSQKNDKRKFYVLSMFPYPSGRLHMGHVRVYTISDTIAHYHRMNGKQVLHPMGWDAFGLPAENAAIERDLKPEDWTYSNIAYMRRQLKDLATTFNWEREVTTCSPDYYRWTQLIFLRLFKSGLAYQKEAMVNWDPVDKTVLANEQVDEDGCSWRSGAKVEQRLLKQWFLRMSRFSKALKDGLDDLPHWPSSIKSMQDNWIGDCSGAVFDFRLKVDNSGIDPILTVHAGSPELIFGTAYIVLSPSHTLLKNESFLQCLTPDVRSKVNNLEASQCDVDLGITAENPFSGESVPLFASSIVPFEENVTLHLGIPASSTDDLRFAERHSVPFKEVLQQQSGPSHREQELINSGKFSGIVRAEAREAILQHARSHNIGGHLTSPRQYDWLISRQRYWGTPIPIIHCPSCKAVPVPEDQLPVILPKLDSVASKGGSPLTRVTEWYQVNCPQCGTLSRRETDTMDTFVDSSWYFLRYADAKNGDEAFSKEAADRSMPVDLYIGGKEHAILHLLYARFITHFLHQEGMMACKEPFKRLLVQGLVMGQSYKDMSSGRYLTKEEVDLSGPEPCLKSSGEPVEVKWEKMSKSKYNGVDPEESIAEYGVDTVRLFILSGIPPENNMPWNVNAIPGVIRWKKRMWSLVTVFRDVRTRKEETVSVTRDLADEEASIRKQLNYTISEVTKQYEDDFMPSVAISRLMTFTNFLQNCSASLVATCPIYEEALCALCIMVAPMAPLTASEMWRGVAEVEGHLVDMRWDQDILDQEWPRLVEEPESVVSNVMLTVKVNNKTVGTVQIPAELLYEEERLKDFLLQSPVLESVGGQAIRRTVVAPRVPLVNILVDS